MKNNWHLLSACLFLFFFEETQAQLFIQNGAMLHINGAETITIQNGDLVNNGSFDAGTGTVVFKENGGTANASIGGSSPTTFHHLTVQMTAHDLSLAADVAVNGNLSFASGNFDLNGFELELVGSGQIVGEAENSRIIGPAGGGVFKTVALNAPNAVNPGNIGAAITSTEDLGTTTIRRGHDEQDVNGEPSILRHYTITPANNTGLDATVSLVYFDAELNGNTEGILEPYRFDGLNWEYRSISDSDAALNFVETDGVDAFSTWTLAEGGLKIAPKLLLSGNYTGSGAMSDQLRSSGLLPDTEPYTALGFNHVGGGGEMVDAALFNLTGNNAIVDWVMLELRDKLNHTTVLRTRSALLQKDGDIVDLNGSSPVAWQGMAADDYYLVVRHRNHLGIMSAGIIALTTASTAYDFTQSEANTYGGANGIKNLGGGFFGLYSGDVNHNGQVQNTDITTLLPTIGNAGYLQSDLDLNGQVQNTDLQQKLLPNSGKGEQHN
jgi:hypothetical protein